MLTLLLTSETHWYNRLNSYSNWILATIPLLSLYVAYRVRQEFLRNQTRAKQVEVMTNLITELNTLKVDIQGKSFDNEGGSVGSGWMVKFNLFEIADLYTNSEVDWRGAKVNFGDYDDQPVLFDRGSNQIGNIKLFIDNPFLPKPIADRLMEFFTVACEAVERTTLTQANSNIIVFTTGIFDPERDAWNKPNSGSYYLESNALAFRTWLNCKAHANGLMQEISDWFKKHGIDDMNLRIDYKNI
jgi:hypothetical protein